MSRSRSGVGDNRGFRSGLRCSGRSRGFGVMIRLFSGEANLDDLDLVEAGDISLDARRGSGDLELRLREYGRLSLSLSLSRSLQSLSGVRRRVNGIGLRRLDGPGGDLGRRNEGGVELIWPSSGVNDPEDRAGEYLLSLSLESYTLLSLSLLLLLDRLRL